MTDKKKEEAKRAAKEINYLLVQRDKETLPTDDIVAIIEAEMPDPIHKSGARMIPTHKGRSSAGWREVRGKDVYFRSRWEFNYCLYLQWLFSKKLIALWKYEPRTFWFEKIKRGVCSYKPDFEVWNCDGSIEYHEVKGYDYPRGKTARKRMAKYYPDIKLRLIDADWFKTEGKKLAWLKGWEK